MALLATVKNKILFGSNNTLLLVGNELYIFKINGKIINKFSSGSLSSFNGVQSSSVTLKDRVNTPSVSIDGDVLSIDCDNGSSSYIYVDNQVKAISDNIKYDLTAIDVVDGTYSVKIISKKDGFIGSLFSNSVDWVLESGLFTSNGDIIYDSNQMMISTSSL